MTRIFQVFLTLLYIVLGASLVFALFYALGIRLTWYGRISLTTGWALVCFTAHRFLTGYFLVMEMQVRRPLLAEEKRLEDILAPVIIKSGISRHLSLWIEETSELNATAIGSRTICVSRGLLGRLSDSQLKAVIAHEIGHLLSGDSVIGSAFGLAGKIPALLYKISGFLLLRQRGLVPGFLRLAGILLLLGLLLLFYRHVHLLWFFGVIFFARLDIYSRRLLYFCWRAVTRFVEYKQDAYAHSLGYGKELLDALQVTLIEGPVNVNLFRNVMESTHPIPHNRIRRLEKLTGLRV